MARHRCPMRRSCTAGRRQRSGRLLMSLAERSACWRCAAVTSVFYESTSASTEARCGPASDHLDESLGGSQGEVLPWPGTVCPPAYDYGRWSETKVGSEVVGRIPGASADDTPMDRGQHRRVLFNQGRLDEAVPPLHSVTRSPALTAGSAPPSVETQPPGRSSLRGRRGGLRRSVSFGLGSTSARRRGDARRATTVPPPRRRSPCAGPDRPHAALAVNRRRRGS